MQFDEAIFTDNVFGQWDVFPRKDGVANGCDAVAIYGKLNWRDIMLRLSNGEWVRRWIVKWVCV